MATSLTEAQVPYTGPYGLAAGPIPKSKGATAEALKRAMSRLGHLEWRDFDMHYNKALEDALDKFDPGGKNGYGDGRWKKIRSAKVPAGLEHAGEWALDRYARTLIQNEAGLTADSDQLASFQHFFTEFCEIAVAHGSTWRYNDDHRPVALNVNPALGTTSDCSGSGIQAADYARRKAGLVDVVRDPARQNWTGYGNTDWYEDDWPRCWSPYRVGDAAHFHSSRHVMWCITPGTQRTARWFTFGRQPPSITTLLGYYRFPSEFMFVVRPDYIPDDSDL